MNGSEGAVIVNTLPTNAVDIKGSPLNIVFVNHHSDFILYSLF